MRGVWIFPGTTDCYYSQSAILNLSKWQKVYQKLMLKCWFYFIRSLVK